MSYDNCIEYLFGENMLKLDKIYDAKNILSKIASTSKIITDINIACFSLFSIIIFFLRLAIFIK